MKALYSNIMRLILTIGLSERDLFVDKVSKIISEKMDADPQRSEHIAESLLRMAESLKDELLLRQLFAHTRFGKRRRKVHKIVHTTPERIRMTIEDLGPTFVKFGQILADRPDMVSEKFRIELKKLQSRAVPFDSEYAIALIEKELNAPLEQVFSEFDRLPLAAASIGQVYQGRLLSGDEVVVKIQRPFVENKIKLDIYLLKYLSKRFAKQYPELAAMNITGLIDEFSATILKELDYTIEASNINRFRIMFKDNPSVHIPVVHTQHCTKKLLVMEKIHGIPPDDLGALQAAGLDLSQIARNGADALLTMILKHGFFHADPHPGNIFVMEGNVIGFIDFGMVGALTPRDLDFLADFAIGFVSRNSDTISHALVTLCGKKFFEHREELKFEIHQMMMQYTGIPIETINFAGAIQNCVDIIVKYKLQIPSGIFMLIKALATLEKFATSLDPSLALAPVIVPYAKEVVKGKYSPRRIASEIYDTLNNYVSFIRDFPNDVSEILYKLKEGKIKHDVILDDNTLFIKTIRMVSRRIAYVIMLIGLFIGSIVLIVFDRDNGYGHFILIATSILILLQMLKWLFSRR